MPRVELDKAVFDGYVSGAKGAVSAIPELKVDTLKNNNLSRITNLFQYVPQIGKITKNFKQSADADFNKMKSAAMKIENRDKEISGKLFKNS
jgi:type VII secretion effector (TIGR04197 family)